MHLERWLCRSTVGNQHQLAKRKAGPGEAPLSAWWAAMATEHHEFAPRHRYEERLGSRGLDEVSVSWTTLSREDGPHCFTSHQTWGAYMSGRPWGRGWVLNTKAKRQNRPGCVQLVACCQTPDRDVIIGSRFSRGRREGFEGQGHSDGCGNRLLN